MRLIDADLLKERIAKWLKPSKPDETEMIEVTDALVSTMMEIDEQPTVLDVDKVVEQLKTRKTRAAALQEENTSEYFEGEADAFEFAIKIVKEGGWYEQTD